MALSAVALRLAAGDPTAVAEARDWPALFALARRERLAALAWHRQGAAIRDRADAATVARWRAHWADATRRGEELLSGCAAAGDALSAAGIRLVILKGAPLADRLYGDAGVRCSDDADCFVRTADRALATRTLAAAGWRPVLGESPGDQTFALVVGDREVRLEVHSSLVAERLSHLPTGEPGWATVSVAGRALAVHAGPLVPAYLAAHLATHFAPPLLWWLDLREVWAALDEGERVAARRSARAAGLARYLDWGLRGAAAVDGALAGDARALRRIGVAPEGRRDTHQLWRHLALAPTAAAASVALRRWVRPPWAAERDGGPLLGTLRRVLRHGRTLLGGAPSRRAHPADAAPAGPGAAIGTLSAGELIEAARVVVAAGGELTVTLSGESMSPTLRPGDRVLLGAPRPRTRPGDIVLVALDRARPVIHRVVRAGGAGGAGGADVVVTRGDNCAIADPPVARERVLASVVASERRGVWTAHQATLRFGTAAAARGLALAMRAKLARLRRRARRGAPT